MKDKQRRRGEAEGRMAQFRAEFPILQSRLDLLLKDTSDFSHDREIATLKRKIEKGKALLAAEKKDTKVLKTGGVISDEANSVKEPGLSRL